MVFDNFNKDANFLEQRLNKISNLRYKTKHERDALLIEDEFSPLSFIDAVLPSIKNTELYPINDLESLAFLLKVRENSVSDILNIISPCQKCKGVNDINIDLSKCFILDRDELFSTEEIEKYPNFPIGLFENIYQIINKKIADNLVLYQYNEIEDIIFKNNKKILNLSYDFNCRLCSHKNEILIPPMKILSKVELKGLYEEIASLTFFTHNGYNDIMEMFPFERDILTNLSNKNLENTS